MSSKLSAAAEATHEAGQHANTPAEELDKRVKRPAENTYSSTKLKSSTRSEPALQHKYAFVVARDGERQENWRRRNKGQSRITRHFQSRRRGGCNYRYFDGKRIVDEY
jgi:hypothetical protein